MVAHPARIEARVSSLERLQTIQNARIEEVAQDSEELARDMRESIKQIVEYQIHIEKRLEALEESNKEHTVLLNRILEYVSKEPK